MKAPELKRRDQRLDIAKGLLIVLVVLGHLLEGTNFWTADTVRLPLTFIYAFHMPAFAFLTGITGTPKKLVRRIGPLVVLLVLFQSLYFGATRVLKPGADFEWNAPFWMLWFLVAMIWWLLLTPIIDRFPRSSILGAILLGIAVTVVPWIGYPLSLGRALVFLPFYAVGYVYGKRALNWCMAAPGLLKGVVVGLALITVLVLYSKDIQHGWYHAALSSEELDATPAEGLAMRSLLLGVAALSIMAFLMLVPTQEQMGLAKVGRHTLPVFLLHGFIVLCAEPYLPDVLADKNIVAIVLVVVLAAGTVLLTSGRRTNAVMRDVSGYLFKRPIQSQADTKERVPSRLTRASQH
ncbi:MULTISPECIES: acyltransferase family protein [Arthrobacter]|uniref:acyltransferase family protein n=1 Tax=Arthrobacter TaxID=1663 RepID=UPI003FD18A4B